MIFSILLKPSSYANIADASLHVLPAVPADEIF
jgi:hypothetical protein